MYVCFQGMKLLYTALDDGDSGGGKLPPVGNQFDKKITA